MVRRKAAAGMAAAWLAAAGSDLSCPYFIEARSSLGSSSPLFPDVSPLFSEAGSNLYWRNVFLDVKQAATMHSSSLSSGWKQFTLAHPPPAAEAVGGGCLPPFKPGPVQDSVGDGGCLAGCIEKQSILPMFP